MSESPSQNLFKLPNLSYNATSGHFLIRLPPPYEQIILTPAKISHAQGIFLSFNDPLVYRWTTGPAYPYPLEDAMTWLSSRILEYNEELTRLDDILKAGKKILLGHTIFRTICEELPNGEETFIGELGLFRCTFPEVLDFDRRWAMTRENEAKDVGDPTIVWMIADYLAPSHHGQGIMTCAIRTLIREWAVPYMAVRHIRAYILTGNFGSRRVFEKLQFTLIHTTEGGVPTQGKRDNEVGIWVMDWIGLQNTTAS